MSALMLALILAGAPELAPEPAAIHGGQPAAICEFPTAVALYENNVLCSATLVHPRLVLTAAHCIGDGPGPSLVSLGESAFAPARTVAVDHCLSNPAATGNLGPWDYAYCLLAEAVDDIPPTPILMGCETDLLVYGQQVVIAGFGADDADTSGIKGVATTIVSSQGAGEVVLIGADGTAACSGDSGGPAFIRLGDGSWRAFGIVSGGADCDGDVTYVTMHSMIGWVEAELAMDITPCHDADGSWNPGPECTGFSTSAHAPELDAAWPSCSGELGGPSSSCGPAHASEDDVEPPQVAFVTPDDGQVFAEVPATIDITITATDAGSGVELVELLVDGQAIASDEQPPWQFPGAGFPAGTWALTARAVDWRGNAGEAQVTIVVGDVPGDGDGDGDTDGGESESGDTGSVGEIDDESGCGCRSAPRSVGAELLLLVLALRRRRTRC